MAFEKLASRTEVGRLIDEVGVAAAGTRIAVAAVLYTYRCTIACRHCCFGCAENRPGVRMSSDRLVANLRSLHELGRVVHIAGGECMMYWDELAGGIEAAHTAGVAPHFIETNCSFAHDDSVVRERFRFLEGHGVRGILFSADPFHQAFVPAEHAIRVRHIAGEVFGEMNVWGPGVPDETIRDFEEVARDRARLRTYVREHTPVLVGSAQRELGPLLDSHPLEEVPLDAGWFERPAERDCGHQFRADTIWEVHIDPYENIQTNCGVILGCALEVGVADVMARGPENANEIVGILATAGPFGLAELARDRHGFAMPARARSKCDLCYTVRTFLRPHYPDILGPDEIY